MPAAPKEKIKTSYKKCVLS